MKRLAQATPAAKMHPSSNCLSAWNVQVGPPARLARTARFTYTNAMRIRTVWATVAVLVVMASCSWVEVQHPGRGFLR